MKRFEKFAEKFMKYLLRVIRGSECCFVTDY